MQLFLACPYSAAVDRVERRGQDKISAIPRSQPSRRHHSEPLRLSDDSLLRLADEAANNSPHPGRHDTPSLVIGVIHAVPAPASVSPAIRALLVPPAGAARPALGC